MPKRVSSIQETESTLLFSDVNSDAPKEKKQKIVPNSPQLRQLLMKKIVVDPGSLSTTKISASQEEKSAESESRLSSVPTAFEVLGVTEEEDRNNTLELKKMLHSDITLDTIISLCSEGSDEENGEKEEDSDHSHLSLHPDSLELTSGDLSIMGPHPKGKVSPKQQDNMDYSIINLTSESEPMNGTQSRSESEDEESEEVSRLDGIVKNYMSRYGAQLQKADGLKSSKSVEQALPRMQSQETKAQAINECSLSDSSIEIEKMESEEDISANDSLKRTLFSPIESPKRKESSVESPKQTLFSPIGSPKRTLFTPTHSSVSSPIGSPSKSKGVDSVLRIPSVSLSQQSNPMSPPLTQSSSSSRHRTLLVALEEELAHSELGKAILDSIRPLYVIGPFIRSPVHGVCLVMRQVNEVLKRIALNVGICDC